MKYTEFIGQSIKDVAESLDYDSTSYEYLENMDSILSVRTFEYSDSTDMLYVRSVLLKLWKKLLWLLKTGKYDDETVLYKFMTYILMRSEFLLENCEFVAEDVPLAPTIQEQLNQYVVLLKLSLMYLTRAVSYKNSNAKLFVYSILSHSLLRIPEFRFAFLSAISTTLRHQYSLTTEEINGLVFNTTARGFMDKYIDAELLKADKHIPCCNSLPCNGEETLPLPIRINTAPSHSNDMEIEGSSMYEEENAVMILEDSEEEEEEEGITETIPPIYVLRGESIVFTGNAIYSATITGSENRSNPYSSSSPQDILRNDSLDYSPCDQDGSICGPPMKLRDMNVYIDIMMERTVSSREMELFSYGYKSRHPSLFSWSILSVSDDVNEHDLDAEDLMEQMNVEKMNASIGQKYLENDTLLQIIRKKELLSCFISYYIKFIRSLHKNEIVCWELIPGFALLERCFCAMFQEYFVSNISSGIINNCGILPTLRDDVAYLLCDACIVDGYILNIVLHILFDKCNCCVLLDVSKSLRMLHYIFKYIRNNNRFYCYTDNPRSFYDIIYSSREIKLLLHLQEKNRMPTVAASSSYPLLPQVFRDASSKVSKVSKVSSMITPSSSYSPLSDAPILCDLKTELAGENELYGTVHSVSGVSPILDGVTSPSSSVYDTIHSTTSKRTLDSTIMHSSMFIKKSIRGFTKLQACHFLLENHVIHSRGEGYDFLCMLEKHQILFPVYYDRRFKTTLYQIASKKELKLFFYPEVNPYSHTHFAGRINYVCLHYVLKSLLKSSHAIILEKALAFIYYNVDFFSGKQRYILFHDDLFPLFPSLFTHWNDTIRELFYRILLFKMVCTRWSYLPCYSSDEILSNQHTRIDMCRKKVKSGSVIEDGNILGYDVTQQKVVYEMMDKEEHTYYSSQNVRKESIERRITCLKLSEVRETQSVDCKLAHILKANLHILLNMEKNELGGKSYLPKNQLSFYWSSIAEYCRFLKGYEKIERTAKPVFGEANPLYNNGKGTVYGSDIGWSMVVEMESRISDSNLMLLLFVGRYCDSYKEMDYPWLKDTIRVDIDADPDYPEPDDPAINRPQYRNPTIERAVKVYTVNQESRYLLIRNIPTTNVVNELIEQLALYGTIEEYDNVYHLPMAPFTQTVWVKYQLVSSARQAKQKMNKTSFFGQDLWIQYVPEHESVADTKSKLQSRKTAVLQRMEELMDENADMRNRNYQRWEKFPMNVITTGGLLGTEEAIPAGDYYLNTESLQRKEIPPSEGQNTEPLHRKSAEMRHSLPVQKDEECEEEREDQEKLVMSRIMKKLDSIDKKSSLEELDVPPPKKRRRI